MVLFSVIIPHYNSVKYLEELIETIPVCEDVQLIVVDDKSDEDTAGVEAMVKARGGLFLHNTTDKKGAGTCRNLGLKEAVGKWLLFADADDYYTDDAFEKVRAHADSDADIIYFAPTSTFRYSDTHAKRHINYVKLVQEYLNNPSHENEISMRYKFIIPVSKMVRNELVQKNGFTFDEVPASNDVMFSLKCAYAAGKIEVTEDVIYRIISGEGTLTTKKSEKNYWARVRIFKERYHFLKERLMKEELKVFGISTFSGIVMIYRALKQGYGMKMAGEIWEFFRKNQVKLIDMGSVRTSVGRKVMRKKSA